MFNREVKCALLEAGSKRVRYRYRLSVINETASQRAVGDLGGAGWCVVTGHRPVMLGGDESPAGSDARAVADRQPG